MKSKLEQNLEAFRSVNNFTKAGQLCVALVVSRAAKQHGFPINPEDLVTAGTGQVAGLGRAAVQRILKEYGITRIVAEEGGRTSRGSLGNMRDYVRFLNELHAHGAVDLGFIEKWWVARVTDFFSGKPFTLKYDPSRSMQSIVHDLLLQAKKRQQDNPGTTYVGTVLQHLVGAKLDLILPDERKVCHHGASVADASTDRPGDFVIDNVALHVTAAPTEALMRKCKNNIDYGMRPIIVTTLESRPAMESMAKGVEIDSRVDIIDAEQFIATNIFEWSCFSEASRKNEVARLLRQYNRIVEACETDPSLIIKM